MRQEAPYMKLLSTWKISTKHETGNTGIRPGATVDVAIGDINGDGQPSIAITKIEDKSK